MLFANPLVPIDFSEGSRAALELAARLTCERLTLLYVHDDQSSAAMLNVVGIEKLLAEVNDRAVAAARTSLQRWAEEALGAAIPYAIRVRVGWPPQGILAEIEEGGHDLVVMATHGRTGLSRAVAGSVAERVLRRSPVPVLTIR